MERAMLLSSEGVIRAEHLSMSPNGKSALTLPPEEAAAERKRILEALEQNGGNQTYAARALGISRGTLLSRLDAYGIRRPRKPRKRSDD
jgi:DNA-binding NtrC family response regulator